MQKLNVGVVGATGVVGETFIELLESRKFPVGELRLFASGNSAGQSRTFQGKSLPIRTLEKNCFDGLQTVFFSAGEGISKDWAPEAAASGAFAIDNSSAFRMNDKYDLVVPEVNGDLLDKYNGKATIIANPNCSTIQLVVALEPLHKKFGITQVRVASYQSVSGAGRDGVNELHEQTQAHFAKKEHAPKVFPKKIAFNSIPQIGEFDDSGFSGEERKIMFETRKIMRHEKLKISAFTVRVPTANSHAEVVWVSLKEKNLQASQIETALKLGEGLELIDVHSVERYPTQTFASGKDPVYVGRIHPEMGSDDTWMMWVVADNLRKGAALNGIQIAERIFDISQT